MRGRHATESALHTRKHFSQHGSLFGQNNLLTLFLSFPQVIVDAEPKTVGLPTEAYRAVEEVHDDGTPTTKTFEHVASEIGAEEAEEVGVEHLLR